MVENWRAIPEYGGEFEVSDLGRVRRLYNGGEDGWRILKLTRHGSANSYLVVNLSREGARAIGRRHQKGDYKPGTRKYHKVHRLVLEVFVGPCPPDHECRHLDDDGFNNRLSNLVWGTHAENIDDARRNGKRKGVRNHKAKLTEQDVIDIRRIYDDDPCHEVRHALAAQYAMSRENIRMIVQRKLWTHV